MSAGAQDQGQVSARAQDWNLDRDPGGGGRPCRDPARKVGVIAALPRVQWEGQRGNPLSAETGMLAASECFRPPGPARWTGAPGGDPRAGVAQRHRAPVAHASGFRPDRSKRALVPKPRTGPLRPPTGRSLTAGSLGAGPAVVGVVTNAVIATQQGSSEGQTGSPRSQPRRCGLPRPSPGHVSAPKHHESTDDSQTCGAPDPVPPRNGVRPVPRGAGTTETGLGSPRPSPPADSPAAPRGGPLTNTHDRPS